MKKIPTLYVRDAANPKRVTAEITPGCEWVLGGEGRATKKWDGTACAVIGGILYKRYDGHRGDNPAPPGFVNAEPGSTHKVGWLPVGDGPEDQWHRDAWTRGGYGDGTWELCGPKVQGNPHGFEHHVLIPHGVAEAPLTLALTEDRRGEAYAFIEMFLRGYEVAEGVVWHHPDGRMAKIKRRDFGLPWPVKVRR